MIDNLYSTELGVFVNQNLIYVFLAVVIRRWSQTYLYLLLLEGRMVISDAWNLFYYAKDMN